MVAEPSDDMIDTTTSAEDMVMIRNTLAILNEHYPNHPWAVRIDGGVLEVKNHGASGRMGFAIPLPKLDGDYGVFAKKVKRAGGELLERYRIRRGTARGDDYALMRRDIRGDGIADR
jgi:hypothetical protein